MKYFSTDLMPMALVAAAVAIAAVLIACWPTKVVQVDRQAYFSADGWVQR